jgi:hypothetical protein
MRWRLIIEEYSPELIYIKGENNIVADALSRLDLTPTTISPSTDEMAESFALEDEDLPITAFPLQYKLIAQQQNNEPDLLQKIRDNHKNYSRKKFRGGGKVRELILYLSKIYIPKSLRRRVVNWYHEQLCHPGETRTELTIKQHFMWPGLRKDVHAVCTQCDTCQRTKKIKNKYGHLPEKEAEGEPWETLCVDLIGPYTITHKGKWTLTLLW